MEITRGGEAIESKKRKNKAGDKRGQDFLGNYKTNLFYYSGVTQGRGEDRLILHFNSIECYTALKK